MKFKHALMAIAALVLTGCGTQVGSTQHAAPAAAPVAPCPTGTTTAAKLSNLDCRVTRLEAAASPAPSPTPTVTPTPSPSGSVSPSSTPPSPTPTPTPTPTPQPQTGFPDASNTGVPAGTTLTAYTGSCTIASPVTIDAKTIACPDLLIQAAGVTITRSKITGHVVIDTDTGRTWSLTLTDSEVDAGSGDLPAIYNGNFTGLRLNIHGGHNGLECQEHSSVCSLKDSYIHDQWQAPTGDTHLGGFLALGSVVTCNGSDANGVPACVELVHNRITCDAAVNSSGGGCTGDANLLPHFGPLHGAVVKDNYFGANIGSSFCTYGGSGMEYPADHVQYFGNVFQRTAAAPNCAAYGPVTNFDSSAIGNVWQSNVWSDGGSVAPAN